MTVYDMLRRSLKGEGSDTMWAVTKILSDSIENNVPDKDKENLIKKVYYGLNGGHFEKELADKAIENFYYVDENGTRRQAPYWAESEVQEIYDRISHKIPHYNFYDFEVTLNMMKSDQCNKLKRWFPGANKEELTEKLVEETINYLDDADNPFGHEKIWKYLNS